MSKQSVKRRETQVATQSGAAKEVEQTLTVEDLSLPSPQELAAYQEIDPRIVEYLLESSKKEQSHRHEMDVAKMKIVRRTESRNERMNFWGMAFAFMSLALLLGICAYALYLGRTWFSGIMGGTAIITIISIFVNAGKDQPKNK